MGSYTGNRFGNTGVTPFLFNLGVMQPCVERISRPCEGLKVPGKADSIAISKNLDLFIVNVTEILEKDASLDKASH